MKKNILTLVFFFSLTMVNSQEIYFNTGKNFTKYCFSGDNNTSDEKLENGSGSFYELGYIQKIKSTHFSYSLGIALNEFNATGGGLTNRYRWSTEYLGVQGGLMYSFYRKKEFDFLLRTNFTFSTIIYGNQEIDNSSFNLAKNDEFKGVLFSPSIGLSARYTISNDIKMSLGYNFINSFKITNTTEEKTNYNTNQIQFGLIFLTK